MAELTGAYAFNSLALLSDAAHIFTASAALVIALGAAKIGQRRAHKARTAERQAAEDGISTGLGALAANGKWQEYPQIARTSSRSTSGIFSPTNNNLVR